MSLEPEQPHHGHHQTGLSWLDLAIALSAILISLTSLIITIVHSRALERMADANTQLVQASSWPFLSYSSGHMEDGTVHVGFVNKGVGPAKIETIELKWKGVAYRNAYDFLAACCGYKHDPQRFDSDVNSVLVLRAGENVALFGLIKSPYTQEAEDRLDDVRNNPKLILNVCYCSVFDECWKADLVRRSLTPARVERCDPVPVPYGPPQ